MFFKVIKYAYDMWQPYINMQQVSGEKVVLPILLVVLEENFNKHGKNNYTLGNITYLKIWFVFHPT